MTIFIYKKRIQLHDDSVTYTDHRKYTKFANFPDHFDGSMPVNYVASYLLAVEISVWHRREFVLLSECVSVTSPYSLSGS